MIPRAEGSIKTITTETDSILSAIGVLQSLQSAASAAAALPLLGRAVSLMLDILKGIRSNKASDNAFLECYR